jgi:hypothetical protein
MTDQKLGNYEDEQTTPAALPARVVSGLEGSDDPGQLESAAGSLGVAESVEKRGGKESIIRQNPRLPVLPSTWSSFCRQDRRALKRQSAGLRQWVLLLCVGDAEGSGVTAKSSRIWTTLPSVTRSPLPRVWEQT